MTELVSGETVRNDSDGDEEMLSNAAAAGAHLGNAAAGAAPGFHGRTGSARAYTQHEDQMLALAVAEHTGQPNGRSRTGVQWAQLNRSVIAGHYGAALQSRVMHGSSKVLIKRWLHLHMA